MASPHILREEWLTQAVELLRPLIGASAHGSVPEKLAVSMSFPSAKAIARINKTVGQCWYPETSPEGVTNIFISPILDDAGEVAGTLLHEMVHAALGPGHGHKGKFIELAKEVGLMAPWRVADPTPETMIMLRELVEPLGPYPHSGLLLKYKDKEKQPTRLLKVSCAACGYTVRTTKRWADRGLPTCVCQGIMRLAEKGELGE